MLDIPGPPVAPLEIVEVDTDACSLSWNQPQEDGGSSITNYIIEKCDVSRGDWVTASASCTQTTCRIGKLTQGNEYGFRVRAENRFGISEPIYSEKMIARHPFGEFPSNSTMLKMHFNIFSSSSNHHMYVDCLLTVELFYFRHS